MKKFSNLELEELANNLIGYDEDFGDQDKDQDYLAIEKYNCSHDDLINILIDVSSKVDIGISPLTSEPYIGFSDKENGRGIWLAKRTLPKFVNSVLEWLGASEDKDFKGTYRDVFSKGKPQFRIIVESIKEK